MAFTGPGGAVVCRYVGAAAVLCSGVQLWDACAGGWLCARLYVSAICQPSGTLDGLCKYADAGTDWHVAVADHRLSAGLFSGDAGGSEMAHDVADFGHRAVLDINPDPQLCVDLHPWRSGSARADRLAGIWSDPSDQHAFCSVDGYRLRLSAADGAADLCQP